MRPEFATHPDAVRQDGEVRIRFVTLDAWRGMAALLVAVFHLAVFSHLSDIALIRHSWVFVDFFFVLSGFVITHAYYTELQQRHAFGNFAVRRFGRLWPLHMATLGVAVLIEVSKLLAVKLHYAAPQPLFDEAIGTSFSELIQNLFLVHSLGLNPGNTWNGPAWSISTEFWTYAVFAFCCALPRRVGLAAMALIAVTSAAIVAYLSPHYMQATNDYGMERCLYGFFTGFITYRLWYLRLPRLISPLAWEAAALGTTIIFVSLVRPDAWSLLAPPLFAIAIWIFACEAGPITNLMRSRTMQVLGAWSYSIYMVHILVEFPLQKAANAVGRLLGKDVTIPMVYVPIGQPPDNFIFIGSKWWMDLVALAYVACVLALASLTYRHIEQPGRRYFNRLACQWFPQTKE